ncbi:MAG: K(+)-transporting ATPase subunit F [Deltaproteobacteria bacterium]|nr:K(+)-transporting ATPase subunit F [Deltaproteobacteria bacterium]
MTTMVSVGAILVAGLLVYLLVALLYPEKLS